MSKKKPATRLEPEIRGPKMTKSPFPSSAEMDLDMWEATLPDNGIGNVTISTIGSKIPIAYIAHHAGDDQENVTARRIEMLGDVYEELRLLQERAANSGLDTSQAQQVLAAFCVPKPFPKVKS